MGVGVEGFHLSMKLVYVLRVLFMIIFERGFAEQSDDFQKSL